MSPVPLLELCRQYRIGKGPVAQGQSVRLITGWLEVRILPGPPIFTVDSNCLESQLE